tara:strand:- start:36 stop:305 length:270 start_codon:yes stop_codon:yes gene_type:complete
MSDGIKQELPSGHLAEVIPFPLPGSKKYNCLRLEGYRKQQQQEFGYGVWIEVLDSAIYLHDIDMVGVNWDRNGEPVFYLLESDNPVQSN